MALYKFLLFIIYYSFIYFQDNIFDNNFFSFCVFSHFTVINRTHPSAYQQLIQLQYFTNSTNNPDRDSCRRRYTIHKVPGGSTDCNRPATRTTQHGRQNIWCCWKIKQGRIKHFFFFQNIIFRLFIREDFL